MTFRKHMYAALHYEMNSNIFAALQAMTEWLDFTGKCDWTLDFQ